MSLRSATFPGPCKPELSSFFVFREDADFAVKLYCRGFFLRYFFLCGFTARPARPYYYHYRPQPGPYYTTSSSSATPTLTPCCCPCRWSRFTSFFFSSSLFSWLPACRVTATHRPFFVSQLRIFGTSSLLDCCRCDDLNAVKLKKKVNFNDMSVN